MDKNRAKELQDAINTLIGDDYWVDIRKSKEVPKDMVIDENDERWEVFVL